MAKRMLIDSTHPEETRVAVISGNRLEEFDFESARKKQIKGNVYLAKVTRVEPSLQACFVEYGGNRHGFLAFNEIHPDYYRIPVADREALNRMVAEAMAEQEDDEEEEKEKEERRPRGRRRGRRGRRGDSDEARAQAGGEEPYASGEAAEENSGGAETEAEVPSPFDQDVRRDTSALDMAPTERAEGGSYNDARDDEDGSASLRPDQDESRDRPADDVRAPVRDERDDVSSYGAQDLDSSGTSPHPATEMAADATADAEFAPASSSDAPQARAEDRFQGAASAEAGEPAAEESVETVGGDELEDIRRRHRIWQRRYKIQEVVRKRQILLVQVAKEERGNKGAALTTYISLAGRYCVLMPNTPRGGGISRKITSHSDRKRLKEIVGELEVPDGMAVIVRTAGMERSKPELRRDLDFLLKTWDEIRERALSSTAPALIYEEANLIKRAVRDLYAKDVEEIIVDGEPGYEAARSFMKLLMPTHLKKVVHYTDKQIPLFHRYQVESQIDNMHSASVQLRSGGYIVLNPTEALVAIDVNSGRSTRERNIEETATRTNLEAADEVARQLRLRDLAGLIVIDFIDMEESRNRHAVERRLKEALRHDRARIQVGRISPFGLLEMSRQRLRPSLVEAATMQCPHCNGAGYVRSTESMALTVLRAIEEEGLRQRSAEITVAVPTAVALYIFNHKRIALAEIERRQGFHAILQPDDEIGLSNYRILRNVPKAAETRPERPAHEQRPIADHHVERLSDEPEALSPPDAETPEAERDEAAVEPAAQAAPAEERGEVEGSEEQAERRGRRRGRRGGRRRRGRPRDDERGPSESAAEAREESTLGPFATGDSAADAQAEPEAPGETPTAPEPVAIAQAEEISAPREEAAPEPVARYAEPESAPEPAPAPPPAEVEPQPALAEPAAPAPAMATPESAPADQAPAPPAEAEPAAPPRRGWWSRRRT